MLWYFEPIGSWEHKPVYLHEITSFFYHWITTNSSSISFVIAFYYY